MEIFLTILKSMIKTIGRFFRDADILLLVVSLICSVYGILLIGSITTNLDGGDYVSTQISALVLGIIFYIIFSYIDIDIIAERSVLLYLFSVLFILSLLIWGEGMEDTGNRAWIRFRGGFGVQPAEVVKITFTIIIARMLVNYREEKALNSFMSLLQIAFVFGSIFALIIWTSSDLGSAIIFAFILLMMMFIAGVKLRWFVVGIGGIAAVFPLIWSRLAEYQRLRIVAPFNPEEYDPDRQGVLWQANQSLRAITNGGFLGQGLGHGELTQTAGVPAQHTDFIFSAAGEELGFVGAFAVIVLLAIIIIRCFYVGIKSNNPIGMLVCVGIAAMFIAQTVENIGMCLGFLPVIGITLPFFSYGGSSIVACYAAVGLVSGVKMRPKHVRFRRW